MEMALIIWLAGVVTPLKTFILLAVVGICIFCLAHTLSAHLNSDTYTRDYNPEKYGEAKEVLKFKWVKRYVISVVLLSVTYSLIPAQKTMYLMLAGYVGQGVVQSEASGKVVKILNKKLDKYLENADDKLLDKKE